MENSNLTSIVLYSLRMLITDFVTIGATPISSISMIFFFISRLSNDSSVLTNFSRFFSLTNAKKIAAMCGRSSRKHCSTKLSKLRNVEIGHFWSRIKAFESFKSCS